MRILTFYSLLILNLFFVQINGENEEFTTKDIIELYADQIFVEENIRLTKILGDAIQLIHFQNLQQSEIGTTAEEYFTTEMTNERLWEVLNSIYDQTDIYSKELDSKVQALSVTSATSAPLAQSLYKSALEMIYEINEHSIENNKTTKDLIDHLREGDIDKYDYVSARSYFGNADFLDILSRRSLKESNRLPDTSLSKWVLAIDAEILAFISVTTRINAYEMMGELNKAKLKEYETSLESTYKKIHNGKSYKKLLNTIDNLSNLVKKLPTVSKNLSEEIDIINRLIINAKLYSDANIRMAETWNEVIKFYSDNINNIDDIHSNSSLTTTFNDILRRQGFAQVEVARYAEEYTKVSTEFTKIAPKLLSL
jgi:hypothetical protein